MKGELLASWPYVWSDIWVKLYETRGTPKELFSELYAVLIPRPKPPTAPPDAVQIDADGNLIDHEEIQASEDYKAALARFHQERMKYEKALTASPEEARKWLREDLQPSLKTEKSAVQALEKAFQCLEDIGGDSLTNRYVILVETFIDKYNLKYDLRRPFSLHPSLSGVFTQLVSQLKAATKTDPHLFAVMNDFEESFRDLRTGGTPARIKACISRQANLLEGLGKIAPNVTGDTLGLICDQVGTWPHEKIKEAMKCLYKFSNDYPGIRHAGTAASQIREIEMRDLVAMTILLTGYAPYLTDKVNSDLIYGGIE